ncbi:glycosyltransferase [Phormidium sp. LEGE 05292]|uniref:glycosyltransferase n=1 Tax=[Phormidium] sp. LEGE 05292 TaxID=767427 RepID=UPI00187EDF2F|nr:glycosyltransferase [Phormidium sp. LEGE 05292]MBE9228319.1 glycosyltransferase [Phormidium sp. LEGE 05292]
MRKFSIVTPCFNAEKYLEETMLSVLNQTAVCNREVELEYFICDGGSQDRTVAIAERLSNNVQNVQIHIISEPDRGMYDALAKGLKRASGDTIAYINAGDFYHHSAFSIVQHFFEKRNFHWLTGYNVVYNDLSQIVYVELPYKYRQRFFCCGFYITRLPALQQESTFWSNSLNQTIDFDTLSTFKYAGDYFLWFQFAKSLEIKIVEAYLGGFRIHKGQISGNRQSYIEELHKVVEKPKIQDYLLATIDRAIWYTPNKIKKILNSENLFRFNHDLQDWI